MGYQAELTPFLAWTNTLGTSLGKVAKNIYGLAPLTTPFTQALDRIQKIDERIEVKAFLFGVNVMQEVVKDYVSD